jgi:hypothetical protein
MKKLTIILIIIILIIIIAAGILILNSEITGNIIKEQPIDYMYTKAICNSSNFCQDYQVECQNNKTISISPITGAVVQHETDWIDPRQEQDRNKLC